MSFQGLHWPARYPLLGYLFDTGYYTPCNPV